MAKSKSYTIAGHTFSTQRALEETVRVHLDFHPLDEPFIDAFLAAVINDLDERIQSSGQLACGAFQRLSVERQEECGMEPRPGPLLLAQFEPSGRWLPVSAYPWRRRPRDHTPEVALALKTLLTFYMGDESSYHHERCDECGLRGPGNGLVWQPISPTWDELSQACLALMTPEEIAGRWGFNRFDPKRDDLARLLPAAHPAIRYLLVTGLSARWAWVCSTHAAAAVPPSLGFSLSGRAIR